MTCRSSSSRWKVKNKNTKMTSSMRNYPCVKQRVWRKGSLEIKRKYDYHAEDKNPKKIEQERGKTLERIEIKITCKGDIFDYI